MEWQCKRVLIAYRSNKCRQELVTLWYAFTDLATAAPTTFLIWSWLTCWTASTTQDVQTSFWSVQLNMSRKDFSYLSPGEKSSEGKHAGWHSSSSRQVKHQDLHSLAAPAGPWPQDTADFCLDSLSPPREPVGPGSAGGAGLAPRTSTGQTGSSNLLLTIT